MISVRIAVELRAGSVVVQLQAHSVLDFVILKRDVVLVDVVPLLDPDFLPPCTALGGDELLEVADRVVRVALHADLPPDAVVADHFYHLTPRPRVRMQRLPSAPPVMAPGLTRAA